MKKLFCAALVLLFVSGFLFAERTAVVRSASGKVEYRSGTGSWSAVKAGMKLPLGAYLSTGFDSRAVLEIGATTLTVAPLTRMRIDQLTDKEGTARTGMTLRVGKVRADVKPVTGLQTDFVIRTPVTTASVRGTVFDFGPETLSVEQGVVFYTDSASRGVAVHSGESVSGTGRYLRTDGMSGRGNRRVEVDTAAAGSLENGSIGSIFSRTGGGAEFGTVSVTWGYEGD